MNKVILLGHLAVDPQAKNFPEKNCNMAKFSLAVNDIRNRNQTYFINCITWNQTADYVSNNLKKGDFISAEGRFTNRSYVNNEGKKVYITEIVIDTIRNYGSKKATAVDLDFQTETDKTKVSVDSLVETKLPIDLDSTFATATNTVSANKKLEDTDASDNKIDWDDELQ